MYAHQAGVQMVPLMMSAPSVYKPNGWLGMLLGTGLWFGFFGATIDSDAAFETKIQELGLALGDPSRGQVEIAAAVAVPALAARAQLDAPPSGGSTTATAKRDQIPGTAVSPAASLAVAAAPSATPLSAPARPSRTVTEQLELASTAQLAALQRRLEGLEEAGLLTEAEVEAAKTSWRTLSPSGSLSGRNWSRQR